MQAQESQHLGNIGYFEVYHIPSEELLRIFTNRDEFEMELEVPDSYDGKLSDIRGDIYTKIVNKHNDWMMEK